MKQKINSLQTVRAIAFLGIFMAHNGVLDGLGSWGVAVFFELSGFVMTYSYYNKSLKSSIRECIFFSKSKISKLYPLHIIMMVVAVILGFVKYKKNIVVCILQVFLNVTLLQSWIPIKRAHFSLNIVSWYLSACTFIYALFPIIIRYVKKFNTKKAIACMLLVYSLQVTISVLLLITNVPKEITEWMVYVNPIYRCGDFIIGSCLACIYLLNKEKNIMINSYIASLFELLLGILILVSIHIYMKKVGILGLTEFKYTVLFIPTAACLIYLFAINKGIISKMLTCNPIVFLGDLSGYAFLIHSMIIEYISFIIMDVLKYPINLSIRFIISLTLTILFSEIYRYIDNRIKFK